MAATLGDRPHFGHRNVDGAHHVEAHRIEQHEHAAVEVPTAEHRVHLRTLGRREYPALHLDPLPVSGEHVVAFHGVGDELPLVGIGHQSLREVPRGGATRADDAPFQQDRQGRGVHAQQFTRGSAAQIRDPLVVFHLNSFAGTRMYEQIDQSGSVPRSRATAARRGHGADRCGS